MLRTVQLLPQKGFRHWASSRTVSNPSRQSATGPPDSYPDRTHTGKRRRARTTDHPFTRSPPVPLGAPDRAAMLGSPIEITDELRRWARGMYTTEAATEMLIRARNGAFASIDRPWIKPGDHGYWIDFPAVTELLGGMSG